MKINLRNFIVSLNELKQDLHSAFNIFHNCFNFFLTLENLPEMLNIIRYYPASQMSRLLSGPAAHIWVTVDVCDHRVALLCCSNEALDWRLQPYHFTPFVSDHHVLCPMMNI